MKISNLYWPVTFFSTAFGAGILFLPQTVGPAVLGMMSFLIFIIAAMIVSLMAHFIFFKFIISHPDRDFLAASSKFIGRRFSSKICVLFILSMMMIVLINFITLVNIVTSFFDDSFFIRFGISLILSSTLSIAWFAFNTKIEKIISKIALLSIILVAMFAVFFFFQPAHNQQYPVSNMTSLQTFSLLPILLFTFNFTPCIQRFAKSAAIPDAKNILIGKIVIMSFITIIVIAISRLLTLEDIYILNDQNVDALFYTAGLTDNQVALFGAGLLLSLLTSGAYIGTLTGVVDGIMSFKVANKLAIITYNAIICTVIGAINPNVVKIIANGSMPIIVITVFFIPSMYFLRHGDNVQKTISALVFLSGLAAITTLLF